MTVYFEKAEEFSRGHDLLAPVKRRVYGPERFAVTGQLFVPLGVPTIGEPRMGGPGLSFSDWDGIGPIHASMELYAPNRHTRADSERGIR